MAEMTATVKVKVKLSLWSAIKLRIAGVYNTEDNFIDVETSEAKEDENNWQR